MLGYSRDIRQLTDRLIELERQIADLRLQQAVVVNELDRGQAHLGDASRTITEYVQARADISTCTARDLVFAARTIGHHRDVNHRLERADITFDRALVTLGYVASGATPGEVRDSYHDNLEDVRHRAAHRRRMTRRDERSAHSGRHFTIQPTLDRTRYRIWGELPGFDGAIVEKAIDERGDELRRSATDVASTRAQARADAIVAMAQDSLDRSDTDHDTHGHATNDHARESSTLAGPTVTVFVDARRDDAAERTSTIAYGPRVGPDTLEALLCMGAVRVVGMDGARPVSASPTSRAIPPAVRDTVAVRDGGCTIDGCRSRYRLQPHHIRAWSDGGTHDPENLTTLCWYHHHVAIHRTGYVIDVDSPPRRRRLVRHAHGFGTGRSGTDPP
jgi:hypothetical protein